MSCLLGKKSQVTRRTGHVRFVLDQCWYTVYDTDPALSRYGLNESFFYAFIWSLPPLFDLRACPASLIRWPVLDQSLTLGQHWAGIGMAYRVCWVCFFI